MLIYNITLKIEWAIQQQWLHWMKEVYIKKVLDSDCFIRYQLVRLLEIDEDEGPTYALQLYAADRERYERHIKYYLPENETITYKEWGNSVLSFSTLMEIID